MAKPELGNKRICPKCASKFYDLNKHPAECPICGNHFDPEAPVKKRNKRKGAKMGADDAAEKVMAATVTKKRSELDDDDDIDLPEFEDLGIIEDIDDLDDLEDVEVVKKSGGSDDEDEEDEGFIDEDDLLDDEEDIDFDDEDEEDDDR